MKYARFKSPLLEGHKENAVEVPFDPAERWEIEPVAIRKGRRGHFVRGRANGVPLESAVVLRSGKFFLRLEADVLRTMRAEPGDTVDVVIQPLDRAASKKKRRSTPAAGRAALEQVRTICLVLPEATEKVAWSAPTFRVRDRQFAMFLDNHHGDGRLALWCNATKDAQETLVAADPEHFFVPPYVGGKGWIGIHLDRGLNWKMVASLVWDGYRLVAPKRLLSAMAEK